MLKKQLTILLICIISSLSGFTQDSATLLIVANKNARVMFDGEKIGTVTKNVPGKFEVTAGEHYLQVICQCPEQNEKSEILALEAGTQKVLKFEFALPEKREEITVAELDFAIPGVLNAAASDVPVDPPTYYYAFEEGDQMIIDLQMTNEQGTNTVQVFSYPDGRILYTNDSFQDLNKQKVSIRSKGIYGLSFSTTHAFGRDVRLTLSRIPASAETAQFDTGVALKDFYSAKVIQKAHNFFINSGTHATVKGGKSRIYLPLTFPENTVKWYYEFTAKRDDKENKSTENLLKLGSELSSLLGKMEPLAFGIDQFTKPPGSDYCDIYLLDQTGLNNFIGKQDFARYTVGSRENLKSGIVEVPFIPARPLYLGIKNPDNFYGVNVAVEVVAIVKETRLAMLGEE